MKKITLIFLLITTLSMVTSCKKESTSNSSNQTEKTVSEKASDPTNYSTEYVLYNTEGKAVGGFDPKKHKILYNSQTYTAKEKEGKRKYYSNGTLTYEVKIKEDTYKLKNSSSKLLWKVKTYPDKIKISDNEENMNPFEIKNKNDTIEISKNGNILYSVKISGTDIFVNDKSKFKLSKAMDNYALGILSIEEIPMEQRLFLLMEYLYQNK
ncbi:hypothetical protein ETU09_02915 [Apibacter muscae]|uniref:Uncharacterized protein n=1 Tax=Apibacter muscae TaxID=2509004 RepID=A0A563DH57_9FLAO|nr:hypothetical protein [Apibacter muscae]TWP29412.1 hypothetical protein ETU09_02915 [Apibacter muscae]